MIYYVQWPDLTLNIMMKILPYKSVLFQPNFQNFWGGKINKLILIFLRYNKEHTFFEKSKEREVKVKN